MIGRPPKPTALKVLEGTARPDRVNPAEPKPPLVEVGTEPPTWLRRRDARRYWRDLVEMLGASGIVAVTDTTALAILAQAFGAWRHWTDWLATNEATYETETEAGSTMYRARPEVGYQKSAEDRLLVMLREFGMTPSARTRITAIEAPVSDPAAEFLNARDAT